MTSWRWWATENVSEKTVLLLTTGFYLGSQGCYSRIKVCALALCPHYRCPTLSPTSERKQYWSCTRCFWSTRSLFALLFQGLKRNWRTQTQVSGKPPSKCSWDQACSVIVTLSIIHLRMWNEGWLICGTAMAHLQTHQIPVHFFKLFFTNE